ncbi:Oxidoreductase family, NAD-binding Rossmann fold protein [Verrucomicrobiia bacterium DG1235]|nr:Oxidoreductase family, NAD-binding Rossmann fold protein [Verrucomicrobiae bacterium DG1235]
MPLTRRHFINKSSSALGLAALSVTLPSGKLFADHHQNSGKNIGIALVGLGSYAMGELAPGLRKTSHCHLSGLVTGTPSKKERYGRQYEIGDEHIYDYDTYDRIAHDPAIDAVYVVLPNSMHAEYSIRAAEAGKHVICEKPMAVSVEECQKMIDACKANGVTLNIGYRLHHDPYHDVFRKLAAEQPHGPAKFVQTEFAFRTGNPDQWRLKRALAGGGAMMDVGIYCIQAARYTTAEEPVAVTAREYKTDPVKFAEVDETIVWEMEFPSGAVAACNTSYNYRAERLHVGYRDDNFEAELSPAYIYRNLKGRVGSEPLDFGNPPQQSLHMDAIAQSINSGVPLTTTGEEGMQDMRIIEAIYRSIANNGARTPINT